MSNELTTQLDASAVEAVLIGVDLSKLTPTQRVNYYKSVCESIGLNMLTKPFDYINLNGKLTLYAKKDATDQLRSIKGVSIDDVDLREVGDHFIVKVKGHDATGRADVEIGVVNKKDMQGNLANAQMKAVTKAKRRLTLSLCGLGWLDETEVETIPGAKPVIVEPETGEIVVPEISKIVEQKDVDEDEPMTIERACRFVNSRGVAYATLTPKVLEKIISSLYTNLKSENETDELRKEHELKLAAAQVIRTAKLDGSIK